MGFEVSDLRRQILDASAALVAEHGVRQVSFREVARRAGVSHQAPYHHFGNYQGILRHLVAEGFSELERVMRTAAEEAGPDAVDGLCAAGLAYVDFARDRVGHFRVMFQKALVDLHEDGETMPPVGDAYGTLLTLAGRVKEQGYCPDMTVQGIAHISWSTAHGAAVLLVEGVFASKMMEVDDLHSAVRDQVLRGISSLMRQTHAPQ
ncbi:MAG: TetR/AcrR family transcriptional regulator [Myxococcota bacterium]